MTVVVVESDSGREVEDDLVSLIVDRTASCCGLGF